MSVTGPETVSSEAVLRELERLLASPALKGSKRSQEFLHYIVEATLRGQADTLKERTLGVALFRRTPDYDTSDDAIVRVKANEVRRRLVQAYQEVGPPADVEIFLPTGSYVPDFRPVTAPVMPQASPLRTGMAAKVHWIWISTAVILITAALAIGLAWRRGHAPSRLFWEPFLAADGTVLISVPNPTVHVLTPAIRDANTPTVNRADIHPNSSDYIGVGDLMAASRLAAHFAVYGKPYQIRPGNDTSFAELRNSPAVFVGAFTNQWTMQMSEGFRYVFRKENGINYIDDTGGNHQRYTMTRAASLTDYAIITRLFESRTGRPVIIAAGLGHYGTQAAGELLTTGAALDTLLRALPADWPRRNMQLVVQVEVLGKSPGPPHLVASHLW